MDCSPKNTTFTFDLIRVTDDNEPLSVCYGIMADYEVLTSIMTDINNDRLGI